MFFPSPVRGSEIYIAAIVPSFAHSNYGKVLVITNVRGQQLHTLLKPFYNSLLKCYIFCMYYIHVLFSTCKGALVPCSGVRRSAS